MVLGIAQPWSLLVARRAACHLLGMLRMSCGMRRRNGTRRASQVPVRESTSMRRVQSVVVLLLCVLSTRPLRPQAPPEAPVSPGPDPVLWPEAQRAFLQDGPGLLLTPEQRTEVRSLDEPGRDAWIQAFFKRTPGLREGIVQRRRLADSMI